MGYLLLEGTEGGRRGGKIFFGGSFCTILELFFQHPELRR